MRAPVVISATTDDGAFNARFAEWWKLSGRTLPAALVEEGIGVARWLATPNSSVQPATPPATVGQGKRAVERDVLALIGPITQQSIPRIFARSVGAQKRARTLLAKRDAIGMENLLNHTYPNLTLLSAGEFRSAHRRWRDSRGRIRVTRRPYATIQVAELRKHIAGVQENVGMARGGWASFLLAKGKSVPGWVSRHANQGRFSDRTADLALPSLELTNRSRWAGYREETSRIMANALRGREVALAVKCQRILNRRAKL